MRTVIDLHSTPFCTFTFHGLHNLCGSNAHSHSHTNTHSTHHHHRISQHYTPYYNASARISFCFVMCLRWTMKNHPKHFANDKRSTSCEKRRECSERIGERENRGERKQRGKSVRHGLQEVFRTSSGLLPPSIPTLPRYSTFRFYA